MGQSTSGSMAVARVPGHLDVFWVGADGHIWSQWWDQAAGMGWADHDPFIVTGPVVPPPVPDTVTFDSGPLTSGLPLGGSAHIVLRKNGDFTFGCHAHDSGFDNIDYVVSAVLLTTVGIAFTFQHSGGVEGTSAGLPFGTPRRDDDFTSTGNNPQITSEWEGMAGATWVASIDGKDALVGGLEGALSDLLKQASSQLEGVAIGAVIALVA